jgi:hypothetical protein
MALTEENRFPHWGGICYCSLLPQKPNYLQEIYHPILFGM